MNLEHVSAESRTDQSKHYRLGKDTSTHLISKRSILERDQFIRNAQIVCLQKVLDSSDIKIREGFRFQIPSLSLLSNL